VSETFRALARELFDAREEGATVDVPPSARGGTFDLAAAYAVELELAQLSAQRGRRPAGWKVGFANKALWRMLGLETLVWARMYEDTVHTAGGTGSLSLARMRSPKIEPEIVFRLSRPLHDAGGDPAAALGAVDAFALGFEIIDCPFPDWKFQPADFVASFGFHAALVVGPMQAVDASRIPALVEQLPRFSVSLARNGERVAEGSGRNVLRSPALCLAELAAAMPRRGATLEAGELVSTGTMTESQPLVAGEVWTATVDGLDLPPLEVELRP
jgi:2-oxo-3-hexenedioate decarboxylase